MERYKVRKRFDGGVLDGITTTDESPVPFMVGDIYQNAGADGRFRVLAVELIEDDDPGNDPAPSPADLEGIDRISFEAEVYQRLYYTLVDNGWSAEQATNQILLVHEGVKDHRVSDTTLAAFREARRETWKEYMLES